MLKSLSRSMHARAVVLALAAASFGAQAADVTGAGASFIYPVMSKWSADYAKATGKKVNYQSIGSGGGIAQAKAGTVDFGSTDAPMKPEELAKAGLIQFPSVIGGVVPVINVPGVASGAMKLDGADAGAHLPRRRSRCGTTRPSPRSTAASSCRPRRSPSCIAPTARAPPSTSSISCRRSAPPGSSKVGEGTTVRWPAGIGGKGNEGVAAYVKQIQGGIGYVELSYALQNKMAYSRMKNAAGNFVLPSDETFAAAAASADWTSTKDFYLVMTNAPGANSWPITATNFILMYRAPKTRGQRQEGPGVLPLGLRERRCAGQGARLRAAAPGAGEADRDLLVGEREVLITRHRGTASPTGPDGARLRFRPCHDPVTKTSFHGVARPTTAEPPEPPMHAIRLAGLVAALSFALAACSGGTGTPVRHGSTAGASGSGRPQRRGRRRRSRAPASTFIYPLLSKWSARVQRGHGRPRSITSRSAPAAASRRSRPARSTSAPPTSRCRATNSPPPAWPSSPPRSAAWCRW